MFTRATVALALLIAFASCERISEQKLVGAWRSEKDGAVEELAFRADHTLLWWMCPAELSTPQTFVSEGKWRIRGNRLEIESKLLTSPAPPQHHSLQILDLSDNSLLVKDTKKEGATVRFQPFEMPTCEIPPPGATPTEIGANIVGTWQVHYRTHDFKYHFAPDNIVAVSGLLSGEFQPLWKGSWRVSGNDLLMDLKPDSLGMGEQKVQWTLYSFERDCFEIKDPEQISYAVRRVK